MAIKRLNHAVLWVRDAQASAAFYRDVLGFEVVADMGGQAVFLRADGSDNDHDLGLFSVGSRPSAAPHSPGLYHLAWQVHTIDDLAAAAHPSRRRRRAGGRERSRRQQEPVRARSRRHRVRGDVGGAADVVAGQADDGAPRPRRRACPLGGGRHSRISERLIACRSASSSDAARRSRAGYENSKPCLRRRVGTTRWPVNSSASASSRPSTSLGPNEGMGSTVGRCSTVPNTLVNVAFVTGSGAVRLTGPDSVGGQQVLDGGDVVVDGDPALPLPSRAEPAAQPELEQRQLLLQRAARRRQHDAGAEVGDSDATSRPGRWPPPTATHRSARNPSPGADVSSSTSSPRSPYQPTAEPDRNTAGGAGSGGDRPRPAARSCCSRLSSSSRLYSSVQRWSPMPAPGQVDDGVDAIDRLARQHAGRRVPVTSTSRRTERGRAAREPGERSW